MGFSTVAAEIMFFIAVVGLSAGVIAVFGAYLDQAKGAMSDKQQYIVSQLRTDVVISNVDNSTGGLQIYVKNVGKERLKTDCLNLYVDGGWVSLTSPRMMDPTTGSAVAYLEPESTLKLNPQAAPLSGSSSHEAKVVTCNGIWAMATF
jgi:archaellum component FlaG (FlaF/FlaG flagellin family)